MPPLLGPCPPKGRWRDKDTVPPEIVKKKIQLIKGKKVHYTGNLIN